MYCTGGELFDKVQLNLHHMYFIENSNIVRHATGFHCQNKVTYQFMGSLSGASLAEVKS